MERNPEPTWKRLLGPVMRIPTPMIFVGAVLLALIVLWVRGDLQGLFSLINDADWGLLAVAAPIYVASLWLLCYRWHLLVVMAHGTSNLPRASEAFLTSVVINYAAPVGLAVPSRAALTKRALGLDASATGTIALWEIGMDVIVLGVGSLAWLVLTNGSGGAISDAVPDSGRLFIALAVAGLVVVGIVGAWIGKSARRRTRLVDAVRKIALAPMARPRVAITALAVSTVYWLVQGVVLWILLEAFGVDAEPGFVLGITSLPILIGMISPIPGGAGVREGLMYGVSRLAKVDSDAVIAAALLYRLALFAAIPILYVVVRWWISRRSVEETVAP